MAGTLAVIYGGVPRASGATLGPGWDLFRSASGSAELRLVARATTERGEQWALIDLRDGLEKYRIGAQISQQFAWLTDDGRYVVVADHWLPPPIDLDRPVLSFYKDGIRSVSYTLRDLGLSAECVNARDANSWLIQRKDNPWRLSQAVIAGETLTLAMQDLRLRVFGVATGELEVVRPIVALGEGEELLDGDIRLVTPAIPDVTDRKYAIRPRCAMTTRSARPHEVVFELATDVEKRVLVAKTLAELELPNVRRSGIIRLANGKMVDGWWNEHEVVACSCAPWRRWARE